MKLKVLASSSKGNCYILSSPTGSLLLECGISFRDIQKGFDFDLSGVVGCLITHSHKDHCKAVLDVMGAGIDVYMSEGTQTDLKLPESHRLNNMFPMRQARIADFIILPFTTEHDCAEPLGFLIQYRPTDEKLLFITDSYYSKYRFKGLNYIMIECNYIKDILDSNIEAGFVDEGMKRRLLESHFSLEHVKEFLQANGLCGKKKNKFIQENDLNQVKEIVLLHLSDGNSDAGRMKKEILELTGITPWIAEPGLEVELELYPY